MSVSAAFAASLPDRPPSWAEVVLALLFAISVGSRLFVRSAVAWPWFAAGFVVTVVTIGPVANSPVGTAVGRWFRGIGYAGRAVVIVLFAVGWWVVAQWPAVPGLLVADAASGGLLGIVLYSAAHLAASREVVGWLPDRQ